MICEVDPTPSAKAKIRHRSVKTLNLELAITKPTSCSDYFIYAVVMSKAHHQSEISGVFSLNYLILSRTCSILPAGPTFDHLSPIGAPCYAQPRSITIDHYHHSIGDDGAG